MGSCKNTNGGRDVLPSRGRDAPTLVVTLGIYLLPSTGSFYYRSLERSVSRFRFCFLLVYFDGTPHVDETVIT